MRDKLKRLGIKLQHPDDVDALSLSFFTGKGPRRALVDIRQMFLLTRIATLQRLVEQKESLINEQLPV
jgi:hypothetical protein